MLNIAQVTQDAGDTWGEAVKQALSLIEEEL